MYQQTRKKSFLPWIIAMILGLFIGAVYYLFWGKPEVPGGTVVKSASIGQAVMLEGQIMRSANPTSYSHTLIVGTGLYGLRSKSVILADYSGSIALKGTIVDILKEIPIVSVDEVLTKEKTQMNTLDFNEKFNYSPSLQLGVDLSQSNGYSLKNEGNGKLTLIDDQSETYEEVMNIQYFLCSPNDPLKDCKSLQEKFGRDEEKKYSNSQSMSFYNLPETSTWIYISTDKTFGYYLYPKREEIFNAFINLLFVITPEQIKTKAKEMLAGCSNGPDTLQDLEQAIISYQGKNKAIVSLEGKHPNGSGFIKCDIAVALDHTLTASIEKARTEIPQLSKNPEKNSKNPETIMTGSLHTGSINTSGANIQLQPAIKSGNKIIFSQSGTSLGIVQAGSGEKAENTKYMGWLQHQSVRGYSVYYSKKGIRFYGQIIDNSINLGIPGISCSYKLSIMPYTNTGDAADVELYECKGSPTQDSLNTKGLSLAGTTGSLSFLINRKTENLKDLQIVVE